MPNSEITCSDTNAPLGMAATTLVKTTPRLCWPLMNKMFLVTVDAYAKWLEVHAVENATSETTIRKLNQIFTTHGLPETIVTDNGTVFTSREFQGH